VSGFAAILVPDDMIEAVSDRAWLGALLEVERALANVEATAGAIPAHAAATIADRCRPELFDAARLAEAGRSAGNPVEPLVRELAEAVGGEAAAYVHRGATSQDIMDTAAMLVAARTRRIVLADLDRTLDGLAGLARRHRDTPMAGRTFGQQAVPTTFGLRAAGWLTAVARARDVLAEVRLPAQLGGAAGTLAAFGTTELPPLFAEETGLAEAVLPWHTLRAPVAELGAALALVAGALGKFGTDVVLLAQTEIGEVAEPAAPGRGGSSAMPHKRNPVLATMVRSAALRVPAYAQILFASQPAALERPAGEWHAEWQPLNDALRLTGGAAETAAELAGGLEVFPDRMRANLRDELLSEHIAAVLAERLGRDAAGEAVAAALRDGRPLGDLVPGGVDPADAVGCAPELVDRALAAYAERARG
jgi:3-carboxy-cis,cis-muconate cycloisomerase